MISPVVGEGISHSNFLKLPTFFAAVHINYAFAVCFYLLTIVKLEPLFFFPLMHTRPFFKQVLEEGHIVYSFSLVCALPAWLGV